MSVSQNTQRIVALLFLITEERAKIKPCHSQHTEHLPERVLYAQNFQAKEAKQPPHWEMEAVCSCWSIQDDASCLTHSPKQ